jgi:hypothetical protein
MSIKTWWAEFTGTRTDVAQVESELGAASSDAVTKDIITTMGRAYCSKEEHEKRVRQLRYGALAAYICQRKTPTLPDIQAQLRRVVYSARGLENVSGQGNHAEKLMEVNLREETNKLIALVFCETHMSSEAVQAFLDALIDSEVQP